MRRTAHLAIVTVVTAFVGVVSCDGGPGAFSLQHGSWDDDKGNLSQRERPLGAQDSPGSSEQPADRLPDRKDNPPITGGGTGGATFVCSGIYECVLSGRSQTCTSTRDGEMNCVAGQIVTIRVRIALEEKGGVCFIGEAVLEPNGVLRGEDAEQVGTWTRQGNGIYIEAAGESSGTCFPSSGPVGIVGSDGETGGGAGSSAGSGSSSSSSSSSGDISIDPGTGEEEGGGTSSSGSGG